MSMTTPNGFFNIPSSHTLRLVQESDGFRVFIAGNLEMNSAGDNRILRSEEALDLQIEFSTFNIQGSLSLQVEKDGETLRSTSISVHSSPLLLAHHLQPAEQMMAMSYDGFGGNQAFVEPFEETLGEQFTSYDLEDYNFDVWLQDEIEFARCSIFTP